MDTIDSSDNDPPPLSLRTRFMLQAIRVVPEILRANKVNTVLLGVSRRLCGVKNESLFQNYTFPKPGWQGLRLLSWRLRRQSGEFALGTRPVDGEPQIVNTVCPAA